VSAEVSAFLHACEGDAVTRLTNEKIPFFNAPIYLQNKTQIGKVDEIFGPINESVSSIVCLCIACCLYFVLFGLDF
jgi:H/ACA ribonucleoprotein complex subunit 1